MWFLLLIAGMLSNWCAEEWVIRVAMWCQQILNVHNIESYYLSMYVLFAFDFMFMLLYSFRIGGVSQVRIEIRVSHRAAGLVKWHTLQFTMMARN